MAELFASNSRKLLLLVTTWMATVSVMPGQVNAARSSSEEQISNSEAKVLTFEVVSVRPHKNNDGHAWNFSYRTDGVNAPGITLRRFIERAYGIFNDDLISGLPDWANSARYDIEAKVGNSDIAEFQKLNLDQRRSMVQALLVDRFKLVAHHEAKDLPIYALVIAKDSSKLQESKSGAFTSIKGVDCLVKASEPNSLVVQYCSMASLARMLRDEANLDRTVVDRTGLTGHYDISLHWAADEDPPPGSSQQGTGLLPEAPGSSIFAALQKQLGLKLESTKGPVDTIVIDHIETPSPN
ncbi:TIGR03435 family protein [Granulicella mallensis]|uniref:Uncharacterized protein (TIGR03435 family) n=1 Tax=Granulicella mallensis TaxID=940614 RepID=A0A7W8EAY4_9BACT|nr:TIGR03435 family protein [Granulicella mallensis]MBB5065267.1 uncharacterized protein (TIGR03435 family) [Granulicella mallensis]